MDPADVDKSSIRYIGIAYPYGVKDKTVNKGTQLNRVLSRVNRFEDNQKNYKDPHEAGIGREVH